ncbi:Uncharacterised protein [Burkholderia pseudomallei]|nr:hypothetical protein X977_3322 [Burkholderia pseudomallei MSHR7504]KGS18980.1 hypothetical protein X989_4386 [Burkholderia pseudomallei MSHR4378]KGS37424.1 hypothetical protein X961_6068 [Burkholderia pseudomallei MSHR5613]KGS37583.1 hypothetical protein X945_5244 [Burkholderia pseudomallei ABCPW 107]KGS41997.1 hypothetical protein X992_4508 [Burkholderia pseudomallei MSHR5492]KGS56412.1 hypothetical protein X949_4408 [Burkholderia pseudomallei MSHR5609]KGS89976.1 hypothetical protein X947
MCAHRLKCWNTIASFVRTRRSCFESAALSAPVLSCAVRTSSPSTKMRPALGCSRKLMQRSIVLLPEPDEPITLITSPAFARSETPFKTSLLP